MPDKVLPSNLLRRIFHNTRIRDRQQRYTIKLELCFKPRQTYTRRTKKVLCTEDVAEIHGHLIFGPNIITLIIQVSRQQQKN